MRISLTALALAGAVALAGAANAEEHEVKMLNKGSDGEVMVFEPAFLKIEPGDTVTFLATDPSHNSESIAEMVPEGGEEWKGAINEEISVTLNEPGVYGYKCLPHYAIGMVGLIQVGDELPNLEAAKAAKHPGRAGDRMAALFEQIEQ